MATVLVWLIIGTLSLAAFTFFVLTPLAWVVRGLANVATRFAEKQQTASSQPAPVEGVPGEIRSPADDRSGLAPGLPTPLPGEPVLNANGVDISFGVWGSTIVPYTTELTQLMALFRPMIESGDERGICTAADSIVAELDQMESVIPPPPNSEAAVHWAAMILLLRRTCESVITGVGVTRNLNTASELLGMAIEEMMAMARIMNAWTAEFNAGELE